MSIKMIAALSPMDTNVRSQNMEIDLLNQLTRKMTSEHDSAPPEIPCIHLAGLASLTDATSDLPTPSPFPQTVLNSSLFAHSDAGTTSQASALLHSTDPNIVNPMPQSSLVAESHPIDSSSHPPPPTDHHQRSSLSKMPPQADQPFQRTPTRDRLPSGSATSPALDNGPLSSSGARPSAQPTATQPTAAQPATDQPVLSAAERVKVMRRKGNRSTPSKSAGKKSRSSKNSSSKLLAEDDLKKECLSNADKELGVKLDRLTGGGIEAKGASVRVSANDSGDLHCEVQYRKHQKSAEKPAKKTGWADSSSSSGEDQRPDSRADKPKSKRSAKEKRARFKPLNSLSLDKAADLQSSSVSMEQVNKKLKKRIIEPINLSRDELMETGNFRVFNRLLDEVSERVTGLELTANDDDDESNVPAESLLSRNRLTAFCSEAAKLKSLGLLHEVPVDRLQPLLTILQWNMRHGARLLTSSDIPNLDGQMLTAPELERLWKERIMDRIFRSLDSALTAMHILTSSHMPKVLYTEELICAVVTFVKYQLSGSIYPEFDPAYRVGSADGDELVSAGSIRRKRAHAATSAKDSLVVALYKRLVEIVRCLADLVDRQPLTDTLILQISSLSIMPFFVENVAELQLESVRLTSTVFAHYEQHRKLILDDIFSSISKLPTSKKNLRNYRVGSTQQSIQMLTALLLQLVQSVVKPPTPEQLQISVQMLIADTDADPIIAGHSSAYQDSPDKSSMGGNESRTNPELILYQSYVNLLRIGQNLLSTFLDKCTSKDGEHDFRPLFDNFVKDLLTTANEPEWPASEILLSLLGNLLVTQIGAKNSDMSARTACLDYIGTIASRLRKDALSGDLQFDKPDKDSENSNQLSIMGILESIVSNDDDGSDESDQETGQRCAESVPTDSRDQIRLLQQALLDYLEYQTDARDQAITFAFNVYVSQWFYDCSKWKAKEQRDDFEEDQLIRQVQQQKEFLLSVSRTRAKWEMRERNALFSRKRVLCTKLNEVSAALVVRYLGRLRPFSQSFDHYMGQILKLLNESSIAIRTKAMKCLASVVEVDPAILGRPDIYKGVHGRFLDNSGAVREAAIDLVGKYVLQKPELIRRYYAMLEARLLDTSLSVKKRVIRIFRDYCQIDPEFPQIPQMCLRIMRRINDEEGLRKGIHELFDTLWFTWTDRAELIQQRVNQMSTVIAVSVVEARRLKEADDGLQAWEQMIRSLMQRDESQSYKTMRRICKRLIEALVQRVIHLETASVLSVENEPGSESDASLRKDSAPAEETRNDLKLEREQDQSRGLLHNSLLTLHLFARVHARWLVPHLETLQPYLRLNPITGKDVFIVQAVANIFQLAVPLMQHPSELFISQIEESIVSLIRYRPVPIVRSALDCWAPIVAQVSHNYDLVAECFERYRLLLVDQLGPMQQRLQEGAEIRPKDRTAILRSLFVVGIMCRHFDLDADDVRGNMSTAVRSKLPNALNQSVFELFQNYLYLPQSDIRSRALQGLGFFCIGHSEYFLNEKCEDIYQTIFKSNSGSFIEQVLTTFLDYLTAGESELLLQDAQRTDAQRGASTYSTNRPDLTRLGDGQSTIATEVVQRYFDAISHAYYSPRDVVRLVCAQLLSTVLHQGLAYPMRCVDHLVAMSTDSDPRIRALADAQLTEMHKKYPDFINACALVGLRASYQLQTVLQGATRTSAIAASSNRQTLHSRIAIRGFREERASVTEQMASGGSQKETLLACNFFLYNLLRPHRQQRRSLLHSLIQQFSSNTAAAQCRLDASSLAMVDPSAVGDTPVSSSSTHWSLNEQLYLADNLALFPYSTQDEPLYVIQQINILVSVAGANICDQFAQLLKPGYQSPPAGEDEYPASLLPFLPDNLDAVYNLVHVRSQGCRLLILLKRYLMDVYNLSDSKVNQYLTSACSTGSGSTAAHNKTYERPVARRIAQTRPFQPEPVLQVLREQSMLQASVCRLPTGNGPVSSLTPSLDHRSEKLRFDLVNEFLEFKSLYQNVDRAEYSDSDSGSVTATQTPVSAGAYSLSIRSTENGGSLPKGTDELGLTPKISLVLKREPHPSGGSGSGGKASPAKRKSAKRKPQVGVKKAPGKRGKLHKKQHSRSPFVDEYDDDDDQDDADGQSDESSTEDDQQDPDYFG